MENHGRGRVGVRVGCPADLAVCCHHKSVRGRERQGDRTEGDRARLWKTDTCPCQEDNRVTAVKTPSSETIGTGVCAPGQGTQPPWLSFLR